MDEFHLGHPAEDAYTSLCKDRQSVIDMGRAMAELTIPSVLPPDGYKVGDDIPGNNQSMNAVAVNTLASELMFMAFPPGQPIFRPKINEAKLQKEIDQDPELYARTQLALSRLEIAHREKLATTGIATAYVGYLKLMLVAGNALWKQVKLDSPTYHPPTKYVVSRATDGHPMVTILEEVVRVSTLDEDVQDQVYANEPELKEDRETPEWLRECTIYSVCKLKVRNNERTWLYWQEHKGEVIEGTEVETDYDDAPMWPGWMIPVFGQNWGRSYCEEYRGDLYTIEAAASGINDLGAVAAWSLIFTKPGGRTSLRQVQKARNLDILSGSAEDVTVFRSEKNADANFMLQHFEQAARRIGTAFLVQSAVMRQGERVTKEEVQRVGRQLDRAMGGLYTGIAQGSQRRIITRAIRLHEEESKYLPSMPRDTVTIDVITGLDAMGADNDATNLMEVGMGVNQVFGPGAAARSLNQSDFTMRLSAYKGVKPDGLVRDAKEVKAEEDQQQQKMMGADMLKQAAGPTAGALAQGMMAQQLQQNQQQPPAEGP